MAFSDPKTIVNRLRGIYTIPVDDGAGLLNGKDTFTRDFDASTLPPINAEAANEIERQRRIVCLYWHIADWFSSNEPKTPVPEWCHMAWPIDDSEELIALYEEDTGRSVEETPE